MSFQLILKPGFMTDLLSDIGTVVMKLFMIIYLLKFNCIFSHDAQIMASHDAQIMASHDAQIMASKLYP